MRCKCASSFRGAYAVFSAFMTCCIIASERASSSVPRVIRVLRVPVSCLHPCLWMHVLRYPCSVRSFQLQKDRFWAWTEDTPQEEEEEEEEDEFQQQQQQQHHQQCQRQRRQWQTAGAHSGEEGRKEKEKDKEKEPEAEGEAIRQQKQELAAAAQDVVVVEGAKGKEGKAKEGKPKGKEKGEEKGKEKGKEKAGGVGSVGFKIEGADVGAPAGHGWDPERDLRLYWLRGGPGEASHRVPFVNRPFESEIHGTVNFTQFCCVLLVTWCYRVLLSCYLCPK